MIRRLPANHGRLTLALSGAFGLWAGLAHAEWQWAVELAQIGAGIVRPPADNTFVVLHARLWTLLHQVSAVALAAGLSERALSFVLSGLAGMVSCQALAMLAFAACHRFPVAVAVPPLVLVSGITMDGAVYPVMLLGWPHTHGMFGLPLAMLAIALIGSGYGRAGGFLLGLDVAVHPSTGVPVTAFVAIAAIAGRRHDVEGFNRLAKALAVGLAVSGLSLAFHLLLRTTIPPADPAAAREYLLAWTSVWDEHRRPVDWSRLGAVINVALPVVLLAWLPSCRDRAARLACGALVVACIAALGLAVPSTMSPERLPNSVIVAMPARLLNIGLFAAVPLIIGLLAGGRTRVSRWSALAAGVVLLASSPILLGLDQRALLLLIAAWTAAAAFIERRAGSERATGTRPVTGLTVGMTTIAGALIVVLVLPRSPILSEHRTDLLASVRDPVLDVAALRPGVLASAGDMALVQIRTRRTVLIDGMTLDSLPYALDNAPAVARILRDVYDIDLLAPPAAARRLGKIPNEPNREAWERFDLARWQTIRARYDVRDVLVFGSWQLELPLVAASPDLRLYTIPER